MADGQLAINSNLASPGLFVKDSNGDLVKVGPVHVGATAPNVSPASGGQAGNSKGEQWLDTASSRYVFKVWDGTAWRTEDGEFVNITGDVMTGALVMDNQQQVQFRETTANGTNYIALQATASVASDKIITLPDITGTVVTTGDTGSVTSTMILDGTIVNADINASAAIVDTKLATIATAGKVSNSATTATSSGTVSTIVARDGSGNFAAGTITATLAGNASTVTTNANLTGDITSVGNATSIATGVIVNDDVNASAAIAGSKISPNFGSQTVQTTGIFSAAAGTAGAPSIAFTGDTDTGFYSPGVNQAAISTAGTGRLFVGATGNIGIGIASPTSPLQVSRAAGTLSNILVDTGSNASEASISFRQIGAVQWNVGLATTTGALTTAIDGGQTAYEIVRSGSSVDRHVLSTAGSERARIDSSGRLLVGTSSNSGFSHQFQIRNDFGAIAQCFTSAASTLGPYFNLSKSRGSVGSPAVVANNDELGAFQFDGYSGAAGAYVPGVRIQAFVDGEPDTAGDTSDMPGRLVFSTTSDGAGSPTERMRITSTGAVTVSTGDLTVYGVRVGRGNGAVGSNTALGSGALAANTTGGQNVALGSSALTANTTADNNVAVGTQALFTNTTGSTNTAVGTAALLLNTTGSFNVATGTSALSANTTGNSNVATGYQALAANTTGVQNVATGFQALANTTGNNNVATGYQALVANTTGGSNVATGVQALLANTTGVSNVATGYQALLANTTGSQNVATGLQALLATTSGTTNTAIGDIAGSTNTTGSNNSFVGNNSQGASATANNVITLGNGSIATLRCQVTTITSLSDVRDKKEITNLRAGLDFVSKLRPVSFTWDSRDGGKVDIEDAGFIAQELLAVQEETGIVIPNLVSQENPDRLEAGYSTLLPVLVNAVQELAGMVEGLQDEITALKGA
jgi:hypothetical protein